jgi:RNA-directed DNA polymerase
MHLRNDMRQKNTQKNLDFNSTPTGEARTVGEEATESFSARHAPENPASTNQLMEEVCERENCPASAGTGENVPSLR